MPAYRHYCFGGTGHLCSAGWVVADDDDQAIAYVSAQKLPVKSELWVQGRLVADIPAARSPSL